MSRHITALLLAAAITVMAFALPACAAQPVDAGSGALGAAAPAAQEEAAPSPEANAAGEPAADAEKENVCDLFALSVNAASTSVDSFPIVPTKITVTGMTAGDEEWKEQSVVKALEKLTNIAVDMTVVEPGLFEERKLIALSSDEYPDFFYAAALTAQQQKTFGAGSRALIDLMPLIAEGFAPNFSALADADPDILASCMLDGALYALPYCFNGFDEGFIAMNTAFLDELELEAPQTTDELMETLRAVKDGNPNGNRRADEIGIATIRGMYYILPFIGCFGIPTDGVYLDGGTVRLGAVEPQYRDFLRFFAECLEDELVTENITDNSADDEDVIDELTQNTVFMMYTGSTAVFGSHAEDYDVFTLTDPADGSRVWLSAKAVEPGTFAITDKCEYPEAVLRWADHFYSAEGQFLLNTGVEDEDHTLDDDGLWSPEKKADETLAEWLGSFSVLPTGGAFAPGFYCYDVAASSADELTAKQQSYRDKLDDIRGGRYPQVAFTDDELSGLRGFGELLSYIDSMQLKFISGDADLDADWDGYLATLEKYMIGSYIDIYQAAYERYAAAKAR